MAAGQLSVTRRALLAGACAAPLARGVAGDAPKGAVEEARWISRLGASARPRLCCRRPRRLRRRNCTTGSARGTTRR
jgi:hypothetical protein